MKLDDIKGYGNVKKAMAYAIAKKKNILIVGRDYIKNQLAECMKELLIFLM